MKKIKIDAGLIDRAKLTAAHAGYKTVEEFVAQAIENELSRYCIRHAEEQVADQLRRLGYIE